MFHHRIRSKSGMTLVEVLVSMGILSVVIAALTSFMMSSAREVKALGETLAKLDTEKLLISSMADGSACTAELANPGLWTPGASSYSINTSNPVVLKNTKIDLSSLHAGGAATANVIIDKVNSISATSKNLKVSSITFDNFVSTGVANQYTTELTVSITGSVRQLKPIILKNLITTIPNGPGSEKITGCLGVGNAVAISSLDNLPMGTVAGYCAETSTSGRFTTIPTRLPAIDRPGGRPCTCIPGWSSFTTGTADGAIFPNLFYSCIKN